MTRRASLPVDVIRPATRRNVTRPFPGRLPPTSGVAAAFLGGRWPRLGEQTALTGGALQPRCR